MSLAIPATPASPSRPSDTTRTPTPHLTPDKAPWWLAAIVLTTMLGFATRGATLTTSLADPAHAAHGVTALGWSLLLVAQAWLAEHRKRDWHRLLAVPATICAITMVASAPPMLRAMAAGAVAHPEAAFVINQLFELDVLSLALFVVLVAVAMANVRRPQTHARAMASSALIALPPGLGRLYMAVIPVPPPIAAYLAIATGALLLVWLIRRDRLAGVRDRTFPCMLLAFVGHGMLTAATWNTPAVHSLIRAVGR